MDLVDMEKTYLKLQNGTSDEKKSMVIVLALGLFIVITHSLTSSLRSRLKVLCFQTTMAYNKYNLGILHQHLVSCIKKYILRILHHNNSFKIEKYFIILLFTGN